MGICKRIRLKSTSSEKGVLQDGICSNLLSGGMTGQLMKAKVF